MYVNVNFLSFFMNKVVMIERGHSGGNQVENSAFINLLAAIRFFFN